MKSRTSRKKKLHKATNIYDVARHARVSVFTVSTVVNKNAQPSPTPRRRVDRAIQKLHYRPHLLARGLAERQTHTIGIAVRGSPNPSFPLLARAPADPPKNA